MAYEKHTWQDGEVITKEKLNNMEDGIADVEKQAGPQGPAGEAAEITSVTATVDANTGTPSVTVTPGGTAQQRTFTFAFKNLKGAKGDTGAAGADGAKGDKGDKGDTGATGANGKDAPAITACTINVTGATISGQLTMSSGEPITISGTYSAS